MTDLHHVSNSFFTLKFRSLSPPGDVLPVGAANKMQSKTAHPNRVLKRKSKKGMFESKVPGVSGLLRVGWIEE